jgi:CheY-like chemotaxis protein/predicted regulator of Ras-like GTPase activity (Roadblock/LC7/MglB family)
MPKVLVVDDSLSVRKVVEKALAGRSVEVLSAASGNEAIERIEQDRPDIVVCDVILPDKDGYQICEYVRAHPAMGRTPVLLISGVVNSTVLARAAEVQSNDVMFKPFAAEELVRKIDGLLGARATAAAAPRANGMATPPSMERAPAPPPPPRAEAAPVSHEPRFVETASAPPTESTGNDLKMRLDALCATPGVRMAALADREGFLIESAGDMALDAEVAAALTACVAESSHGIGQDLGQGALLGMMLEYEQGMLLLNAVGPWALLAVMVTDAAALGKARYVVKKALPDLERAL